MKKRLFFLIVMAILCVTLFSATACADSLFRLQLTKENGAAKSMPYENWYFLGSDVYVLSDTPAMDGQHYEYSYKTSGATRTITLSGGPFTDNKIVVNTTTKTATAASPGKTYDFTYATTATFKTTLALSQEGNDLLLSCNSTGGVNPVAYRYYVYDQNGDLYTSDISQEKKVRIQAYQNGTYTCVVAAVDYNSKVSDFTKASITFTVDPNYVVINGEIVRYNGTAKTLSVPASIKGATITAIGANAFSGCTSLEKVTLPATVTSIGASAFSGCTSLATVTLPITITAIDANAFSGCSAKVFCNPRSDTAVALSDNSIPFYNISSLSNPAFVLQTEKNGSNYIVTLSAYTATMTAVQTPSDVDIIGDYAFANNRTIKSVEIRGTTTPPIRPYEIGAFVFAGCTALETVTLPDNIATIDPDAFTNCGAKRVCACTSLTAKTLSDKGYAFYDTSDSERVFALLVNNAGKTTLFEYTGTGSTVTVPDGVQIILKTAFKDNKLIKKLSLPASVEEIDANAFENCSEMEELWLEDNVKTIRAGAFVNCSAKVFCDYTSDTAKTLSKVPHVFYDENDYPEAKFELIYDVSNNGSIGNLVLYAYRGEDYAVAVPNYVARIYNNAFKDNKTLQTVYIPENVTEIGVSAFEGCGRLQEAYLPYTIDYIGTNAFYGCDNVTLIVHNTYAADWADEANIPYIFEILSHRKLYLASDINGFKKAKVLVTGVNPNDVIWKTSNASIATVSKGVVEAQGSGIATITAQMNRPTGLVTLGEVSVTVYSGLNGLTLPGFLTTLKAEAFADNNVRSYVKIGKNVTSIGDRAFANNTSMILAYIPYMVTSFGSDIFADTPLLAAVIDENSAAAKAYCQANDIPFQYAVN